MAGKSKAAANAAGVPDYQQEFSKRTIKNYIASFLAPIGFQGLSAMLFSTYLVYVYTEYLGVGAAAISTVVSVGVIVDAITDFLMGMITDRVITKWGKAKHWFLIMAFPIGISMALMWMVPATAGSTMKLVYAFIVYNVFCTLLTATRVPGAAIPALVTDSTKIRGNMGWMSQIAMAVGASAVGWIVTPMLDAQGESLATYRLISIVCAAIATACLFVTGILLTEQRDKAEWMEVRKDYAKMHNDKHESMGAQIVNLFKNRYYIQYLIINAVQGMGIFFVFGVLAYWLKFVEGDMSKMAIVFTALNIPNILGTLGFAIPNRFLKPKQIMLLTVGGQMIFGYLMWIFGAKYFTLMIIALCIKTVFGGMSTPMGGIWIPMVIDYGEWKTGSRQEGLCNAGGTVISKIVTAIATASVGFILAANGYSGGGSITQQGINAINFLFFGVPAISVTIGFVLWLFWDLTPEKMDKYRAEVKERKEAARAERVAADAPEEKE